MATRERERYYPPNHTSNHPPSPHPPPSPHVDQNQSQSQRYLAIEERSLSVIRQLELQSLRQEIDQQETQQLAREMGRYLQRIRRGSNLRIETMNELTSELTREKKSIYLANRRIRSLESEIGIITRESINVNAAILQLEQILELG